MGGIVTVRRIPLGENNHKDFGGPTSRDYVRNGQLRCTELNN